MRQHLGRRGSSHEIISAIQQVVANIPAGFVMSYGAVAKRAGFPRHARMVARALRLAETELPWFRVVNHQGAVSPRGFNGEDDLQRMLLEAEGLEFDAHGRLDLSRYAWKDKG